MPSGAVCPRADPRVHARSRVPSPRSSCVKRSRPAAVSASLLAYFAVQDFDVFVPKSTVVRELIALANGVTAASEVERFVLLGVSGKALIRTSWSDAAEVSTSAFEKLKKATRPSPDLDAEVASEHSELDPSSVAHTGSPLHRASDTLALDR